MKFFKDVLIGQTFYTSNGQPSKKTSESKAVALCPILSGFNFQEAKYNVEFTQTENSQVYGIGIAKY
jgi:hypothetical protein